MANNEALLFLIGLPLAISMFASMLNGGVVSTIFITVAALVVAIAAAIAAQALGSGASGSILGTGIELPDIKDFSLKLIFSSTFLGALYLGNVIGGITLILSVPLGIGLIIFGVLTTLYTLGLYSILAGD